LVPRHYLIWWICGSNPNGSKKIFSLFLGLAKPLFGWHSTGVPPQDKILLLDTAQITMGVNKSTNIDKRLSATEDN
jgi:hypothetical protein